MIILDTNVLSELMKLSPASGVCAWVKSVEEHLVLTSITIAEITYGIEKLPAGARRLSLEHIFQKTIQNTFIEKILDFDPIAAKAYGELMANREKMGKPMSTFDAQIAAIALSHQATLATRNTADFADCYLDLVNPFLETPALEISL